MRLALVVLGVLAWGPALGCAAQSGANHGSQSAATDAALDAEYEAVPAAALVFAPPVVAQEPPLMLSREGRAPEAFVGFEQGVVEYHYVRTDDRQRTGAWNRAGGSGWGGYGGYGDRYERRAVSERVGVRYR